MRAIILARRNFYSLNKTPMFCLLACLAFLRLLCLKPDRNELRKLSEESLQRQPEEVFDVLEKLGEGYCYYLL